MIVNQSSGYLPADEVEQVAYYYTAEADTVEGVVYEEDVPINVDIEQEEVVETQ